jgi:uncharacterized protein involved in type VI secretion and phage assembly
MSEASEALMTRMSAEAQSRYYGKYRGLVREVGTGDNLGFIRALVPEIYGDTQSSPWAAPSVPFAGPKHGWITLPEVDDGVWIEFEAGNVSKPIWTGFFWCPDDLPDAAPKKRMFATTKGHRLVLDDEANEVRIEHADGPSIVITDSGMTLKVGQKQIHLSGQSVSVNNGSLEVT